MNPDDVARFAGRDWDALSTAKTTQWLEERRRRGPGWGLRVGHELWRHAIAQRPDWPTAADRAEDLATHQRVSAALRRAHAFDNS